MVTSTRAEQNTVKQMTGRMKKGMSEKKMKAFRLKITPVRSYDEFCAAGNPGFYNLSLLS